LLSRVRVPAVPRHHSSYAVLRLPVLRRSRLWLSLAFDLLPRGRESGPPKLLARPPRTCPGRLPRQRRRQLAMAFPPLLPSVNGNPLGLWDGSYFRGCILRGPRARAPTHRRRDHSFRRKARFRSAGSALIEQDSHLLDDPSNFRGIAPPFLSVPAYSWSH
jgi:hypothetical protein